MAATSPFSRSGRAVLVLVLLALLFVAVNVLAQEFLGQTRIDLTEDRLYTLDPSTERVLAAIEEPITLRFFFSEAVNGPEGSDLPLLLLKRKVKKLIEEENPFKPLTDDALAAELQRQGIQVTRRTVAKYREDLGIPSTHQRRQR